MTTPQKTTIAFITTTEQITDCVIFLNSCPEIAFDFEFDSNRYRYGYTLCLIQISASNHCFIIDPFCFEEEELKPLFLIFETTSILKIIHSGGEDLRILQRLGYKAQNLFDTQVAAQFLGHDKTSLGNIIQNVLGIELNKQQQASNWVLRPLKPEQLNYAANDVLYLSDLKTALMKQLDGQIQRQWFDEEMQWLDEVVYSDDKKDPITRDDRKVFSAYQLSILSGILAFRNNIAQHINRPVYQIFRDEYAREVVQNTAILNQWKYNNQSPRSLRTDEFQETFQTEVRRLVQEADTLDLTRTVVYEPTNSTERHIAMKQRQQNDVIYDTVFKPIKDQLAINYNNYVANNTLSRDTSMQVIGGHIKVSEIKIAYKQQLIKQTAQELGLNIVDYW